MGIIQDIQKSGTRFVQDIQREADAALGQLTGASGSNTSGKGSPSISSTSIPTSIDLRLPEKMDFSNFGSLDYSTPKIPTPNFDFSVNMPEIQNLTPNWDQLQPTNLDQLQLNLDQDLTKLNPEKLQSAAVDLGTDIQKEVVNIGSAVQTAATDAGSAYQQNLIDLGAAAQQEAINIGGAVQQTAIDIGSLTGQRNPTLEAAASGITKATEANIASVTNAVEVNNQSLADWWRANEQGFTKEAEAAVQSTVETVEFLGGQVTKGAEMFLEDVANLFMPDGGDKKWPGGDESVLQDLPELPTTDEAVFPEIEQATTKADQMTEEERLRRIRRLMLNRYGREDTVLTGVRDPMNRRRYAPGSLI